MNKTCFAIVLLLALSWTAYMPAVNLARAQSQYLPPPSIEISSPISSPKIYQDTSIPLYVTVNIPTGEPDITYVSYNLDGTINVTLTNLTRVDDVAYWTSTKGVFGYGTAFRVEASLTNLAEGNHVLNVYSHSADGKEMSKAVNFTVDYNYLPPQPTGGYGNNTATPAPSSQTGTPLPTINTGAIPPSENTACMLCIIIAVMALSVLSIGLYIIKKNRNKMIDDKSVN
ncbi:MAG: hypothetical protein ACQCN4_00445 [Candidatus Bathyarchaeia archaeon]|jgi:hypothetical protein